MKRNTFTIVLVSENREPVTVEFSIKEIVLACVLCLTLISAAVFSIINYKSLKTQHYQLKNSIELLQQNLQERETRLAELKDKLESQKGTILLAGASQDSLQDFSAKNSEDILIQELEVHPVENGLLLNFHLINNTQQDKLLSGYLLIIVEHQSGDLSKFGTFPKSELDAGKPLNYRLGDTYAIRKFKLVEALIKLPDNPVNYNKIKILVFNEDGDILLYNSRFLDW
ncbi:MAG TPA: hypothetical protein VM123_15695 [archaeon]|nr:hypothetical protein [archaeon]